MIENNDRKINFLFIGAKEAGKTSIIEQFVSNEFPNDYNSTIGINMSSKKLELFNKDYNLYFYEIGNSNINIYINNEISEMVNKYLEICDIIIFVYDITNKESLDYITTFWEHIDEKFMKKNLVKIVVGNKKVLNENEYDEYAEIIELGRQFSENIEATQFLISAKILNNVNQVIKISVTKFLSCKTKYINFNENIQNKEIVTKDNEDGNKNEYEPKTEECKCLCRCY
jgi:small GTP-binding protein